MPVAKGLVLCLILLPLAGCFGSGTRSVQDAFADQLVSLGIASPDYIEQVIYAPRSPLVLPPEGWLDPPPAEENVIEPPSPVELAAIYYGDHSELSAFEREALEERRRELEAAGYGIQSGLERYLDQAGDSVEQVEVRRGLALVIPPDFYFQPATGEEATRAIEDDVEPGVFGNGADALAGEEN